jgi:hypothetical protein
MGPFEFVERKGPVAYRLALPDCLRRMHNVYGFNHLQSEHGIAFFGHGVMLYRCLIVCRFLIGAPLVLDAYTLILQSISAISSSSLMLWGAFCYTLFWSP